MTVKEVIELLSKYPEDKKIFSFNEDDQFWSEGVEIGYEADFDGVTIRDTAGAHGYMYGDDDHYIKV